MAWLRRCSEHLLPVGRVQQVKLMRAGAVGECFVAGRICGRSLFFHRRKGAPQRQAQRQAAFELRRIQDRFGCQSTSRQSVRLFSHLPFQSRTPVEQHRLLRNPRRCPASAWNILHFCILPAMPSYRRPHSANQLHFHDGSWILRYIRDFSAESFHSSASTCHVVAWARPPATKISGWS